MKAIIPTFDKTGKRAAYLQLYDYIRKAIVSGEMTGGEKLPSLRSLSDSLKISITTASSAYEQLAVEGYIYSIPQSGYYVSDMLAASHGDSAEYSHGDSAAAFRENSAGSSEKKHLPQDITAPPGDIIPKGNINSYYDLSCFDFNKWKKCINKVFNDYPEQLLFESDPQGESALRREIARYLYLYRGVICDAQQIVLGAGTQQIIGQLSLILKKQNINHIAFEDPGYLPVRSIFRDRGFSMTPVPVKEDGISIEKLPANIKSAVYVSPSNQFPTGALMPVGRRYKLLDWAASNDSIIIEDDYDSELRYFGKPVPALQGLDKNDKVIYLSSFSSTIFPALKISYMVLPTSMADIFMSMRSDYTQTCSKTEQLALALFMEHGFYRIHIKKLRSLYSQKLALFVNSLKKYAPEFIAPVNAESGINILLYVNTDKPMELLCREAAKLGIDAVPVLAADKTMLSLYYNRIPTENIDKAVKELVLLWK